ncbi:penicillin-binding transpeptidase domain-containing protein [Micromonospora sp. M12]
MRPTGRCAPSRADPPWWRSGSATGGARRGERPRAGRGKPGLQRPGAPGSTFKVVSTLGLLDRGAVTLDGPVDCKKTFTVDGRSFKNSDNFQLGSVPFRTDFAKSCNTAFASLAPKLGGDGLAAAGRSLGLEGQWDLGTDAFTGKVSTGGSPAEQAAASFGQGTTLVSPLAMAGATAAVARGRFEQPKLLLDPAPPSRPRRASSSSPNRSPRYGR